MTMQPRPNNSISQRKQEVRQRARTATMSVIGGVGGGLVLTLVMTNWFPLLVGIIIAVAVGAYNWMKIQNIVNHKDEY